MKTVLIIAGSDPAPGWPATGFEGDHLMGPMASRGHGPHGPEQPGGDRGPPGGPRVVAAQLDAVRCDFPVAAVKVGMLVLRRWCARG